LFDIQADFRVWLDNLQPALADSTTAEHLREVCELDLSLLDACCRRRARARLRRQPGHAASPFG
jgi:hypothetical protein